MIHGEIYKARPDVMAVVHHHAPAVMPFCISGVELQPVMHLGAIIGHKVPIWDQYDEFGDTNLLLVKPEEGASLARALGTAPLVLMKGHGATVVGGIDPGTRVPRDLFLPQRRVSVRWRRCSATSSPLRPGEVEKSSQINAMPTGNFQDVGILVGAAGEGRRRPLPRSGKKPVGARAKRASVRKHHVEKSQGEKQKGESDEV